MATATQTTTQQPQPMTSEDQKRVRACAIAVRDNLFATLDHIEYDENDRNGVRVYTVPSRSMPGRRYIVQYPLATMTPRCECLAGQHGLACGHVGAVLFEVEVYEESVRQWLRATGRLPR